MENPYLQKNTPTAAPPTDPPSAQQVAWRSVLAVTLTAVFLIFNTALALFLLWVAYLTAKNSGEYGNIFLISIACFAAGSYLLIAPFRQQRQRWVPPGPLLNPEKQAKLSQMVEMTAARLSTQPPDAIYLGQRANTEVSLQGVGQKKVMLLGYVFLAGLSVSELQCVLAHELTHLHRNSTLFGRFFFATRRFALQHQVDTSWARPHFRLFSLVFLKTIQPITRAHELAADLASAQIVGPKTAVETFERAIAVASAANTYWNTEIIPALEEAYRPPILTGFDHFMHTNLIAGQIQQALSPAYANHDKQPDGAPTDTERLLYLKSLPDQPPAFPIHSASALSLLNDQDELEADLLGHMYGFERTRSLTPVEWRHAGYAIWLGTWQRQIHPYARVLQFATPDTFPKFRTIPNVISNQIELRSRQKRDPEVLMQETLSLLARALSYTLVREGWKIQAMPGEDVIFTQDERTFRPFRELKSLADGAISSDEWLTLCNQMGITNLPLL